ncbi:hypothetical protein D7Y15_04070 [Corallococcus sp. AB030]|nr:hypothetical protein D7X99_01540 [Corallococcus sp. AB032C]RKI19491.1 hypothetical protein D7Y15_04070 [Corallococcus sp. AB030]
MGDVGGAAGPSHRRLSLPALRFVGGDVTVSANARLDSLMLGTATAFPLWVERSLFVEDNPKLPTCRATALAASVFQGEAWGVNIDRNDDAATCP